MKKEGFMQKIAGCKLPEKEALRCVCEKMMDAGLKSVWHRHMAL